MTDTIFGIYGFDFATTATVGGVELIPLFGYPECNLRARDRNELQLTGYGKFLNSGQDETFRFARMRRLVDGMTFCQQQLVASTRMIRLSPDDSVDSMVASHRLPQSLPTVAERHTAGEAIGNDTFFPGSRIQFLEMFLRHCDTAPATDPLVAAIYRQIEVWRLSGVDPLSRRGGVLGCHAA